MSVFLLHSGNRNLKPLTDGLQVPHGSVVPQRNSNIEVVIHWDVSKGYDGCFQYHSVPTKQRNLEGAQIEHRLQLHGLEVDWTNESLQHSSQKWIIPVFHLDALAVFQREVGLNSSFRKMDLNQMPRSMERIIRIAVKTVYCLGLDFAVVYMGIRPGRKRHVIHKVIPAKHWTASCGKLFAQAINDFANHIAQDNQRKERAVLGIDPEFIICRSNGKIVSAGQYFPRHGRAGSDAVVIQGKVKYPLVELRPNPEVEPHLLIHNLRQTMNLAARKIREPSLSWIAGGMPKRGLPLGGHIHMSRIWLNSRLLRVLDNYLALPLILIEDENSRFRRPKYGFVGDFKRKSHGGFEYRTLPSWIVSPKIAYGVIALARLIADHFKQFNLRPLDNERIQKYFYAGEKEKLLDIVHAIWNDLEQVTSYTKYVTYLDPLKRQMMRQQSWNETLDFRIAWKIPPFQ